MAASMKDPNENHDKKKLSDSVIFILNSKIQKARLLHMKKSSRKRGFIVDELLTSRVTHIISELENQEQVIRSLKKVYPSADVEAICRKSHLLKMEWLSTCLEEETLVEICDQHRIKAERQVDRFTVCQEEGTQVEICDHHRIKAEKQKVLPMIPEKRVSDAYEDAKYCCQRITPLNSPNRKYCDALEVLEKHAEFVGGDHQLSRALAFRKASAALRAYPRPIRSMGEVENLYDLKGGKHCKRVIQEILEDGFSTEVDNIQKDEWFQEMELFTGIFGCGSATARKWYEKGHRTLDDIGRSEGQSLTIEQRKGLEHYEDLNTPVTRPEAEQIHSIVRSAAEEILPGATVIMTGGFIRGKDSGHDVDFLISHPEEGREKGLLPQLLQRLRPYLLYTDVQRNTYGEAPSLNRRQNTMDHFERCFSVFKLPKTEELLETSSGPHEIPRARDGSLEEPSRKRVKTVMGSCIPEDGRKTDRSWIARRVDFVITPASQHAFALLGWTGSRMFCRSIRDYAGKEMNMILTSHGLFDKVKNRSLGAKTERDIFQHLNLPYREPHERNC